jgi:hypothetical protein
MLTPQKKCGADGKVAAPVWNENKKVAPCGDERTLRRVWRHMMKKNAGKPS